MDDPAIVDVNFSPLFIGEPSSTGVAANHFTLSRQCIVYVPGCLVAEAIMIVAPRMTCEQNIEGREWPAPGILAALLKPFGVLGSHRIRRPAQMLRKRTTCHAGP